MPKKPNRFWLVGLIIAWAVDFFFYGKAPGLSFLLWTGVILGGVYFLALSEKVRPSRLSLVLALFILLLGAVPLLRREPFTIFISIFLALILLIALAATMRSGNWLFYRVWDYITAGFWLVIASLSRPFGLKAAAEPEGEQDAAPRRQSFWKGAAPVLRGLLIALPVVALLAALLASADLIFAQRLDNLLELLKIEKLPEYIFRLFYIIVLGYLFAGALAHAVFPAKEVARPQDPNQPVLKPFLGWTEAGIVLACVNALFIFFVILQVQYLFGGQANITATGYTYSEYARRGFSELVAVAVISLLLYLGLGEITRRETRSQRAGFSLLSVALLALVLVILASAFQRLLLYENAYGFTRLRTYTFILISWLAILLLATIVLELIRQHGRFGPALLLAAVGFGLTFGALNVDGLIARENLRRAMNGEELDAAYLSDLSSDAIPTLADYYARTDLPDEMREDLGAGLACWQARQAYLPESKWQSFSISANRADRSLQAVSAQLDAYPVHLESGTWNVRVNGSLRDCFVTAQVN